MAVAAAVVEAEALPVKDNPLLAGRTDSVAAAAAERVGKTDWEVVLEAENPWAVEVAVAVEAAVLAVATVAVAAAAVADDEGRRLDCDSWPVVAVGSSHADYCSVDFPSIDLDFRTN